MFKKVNYDKPKPKPQAPKERPLFNGLLQDRPDGLSNHLAIVIPHDDYLIGKWGERGGSFELLNLMKAHFKDEIVSYQEIQKRFPQVTVRRLKLQLSWLWANGFLIKWVKTHFKMNEEKYRWKAGVYSGVHYQIPKTRITNWKAWTNSLDQSNEPQP